MPVCCPQKFRLKIQFFCASALALYASALSAALNNAASLASDWRFSFHPVRLRTPTPRLRVTRCVRIGGGAAAVAAAAAAAAVAATAAAGVHCRLAFGKTGSAHVVLGTGRRDPLLKSNLRNIYQRIRLCVSEPLSWGSWRRGRPSVRVSRTRTTVPRYTTLARLGLTKVDHSILGSHNGHVSVNLGFSFPVNGNGELQLQDRDSTTRYMRALCQAKICW